MQRPTSSTSQRLRNLRRRVAAGVLATFVAAWLAVAALGKGGSSTATAPSTTPSGSTGTQSQTDDGGTSGSSTDQFGDGSSSAGQDQSQDPSQDQSQPGPVVTGQS
jgi:hypothetical protein